MSLSCLSSTGRLLISGEPPRIDYNLDFETLFGRAENSYTQLTSTTTKLIPNWTGIGPYIFLCRTVTFAPSKYISYSTKQIIAFYNTDTIRTLTHSGVPLGVGTYSVEFYVGSQGNYQKGPGIKLHYSTNGGTSWQLISYRNIPFNSSGVTNLDSLNCLVTSSQFVLTSPATVILRFSTIISTTLIGYKITLLDNISFIKIA
jgi:hypothetical protein